VDAGVGQANAAPFEDHPVVGFLVAVALVQQGPVCRIHGEPDVVQFATVEEVLNGLRLRAGNYEGGKEQRLHQART
jgi:hypothetical protein